MAYSLALTRPVVLLACEDPVAAALLRSLLRALPATQPEVLAPAGDPAELDTLAPRSNLCFLEIGYAGLAVEAVLARLRRSAPALRVIGLLGERARLGDRAELVRALRGGLEQLLMIEELSIATLDALLAPPRLSGALIAPPPAVHAGTPGRGGWRIALAEQRATFDPETLRSLGYAPLAIGSGLGDWKALIHPDDVDRLVREVQRVLEGEIAASPAAIVYRLRRADGGWLAVVSERVVVEPDAAGRPGAVSGDFRGEPPTAPLTAAAVEPEPVPASTPAPVQDEIIENCQTALARWRRDGDGEFRLDWCNGAFAALEGESAGSLRGRRAAEVAAPCDGFSLEEALGRVHETGIAETHDALLLARSDPPSWRRHQLGKLPNGEVLLELGELGDLVQARHARRTQDELARYMMRSLPFTTLLVDEAGRILQCVALAAGPLGVDALALEERTVQELLGAAAGVACLQQIARTLNTGRSAIATYRLDATASHHWLECHTALLRALPGMPPRVLLGVLDVSARMQELGGARALGEQLRSALHSLPLPVYLKDAEGRYTASNAAFDRLMGVDEGMLAGKTDFEVFPDDLAAELHATERRLLDGDRHFAAFRSVGVGAARAPHWCFEFPIEDSAGTVLGCGGLWIEPGALPGIAAAGRQPQALGGARNVHDLDQVSASVVNRLEDVITDNADYAGVLRELEQLVETTMQAQALIHNVTGQSGPPPSRPLVALGPLAQEIVDLERILVPPGAHFENHIEAELPPAHCEPVAFHQILLRGIRHARRTLGAAGTLCIRLRNSAVNGGRGCLSCRQDFDGNFVELVIEDSDSRLADTDIEQLLGMPGGTRAMGSALDDLAEIHALAHAQGGHLQIQRNVPSGTSVHVFFRAGDPASLNDANRARSTVTRLPLGRSHR